MSSRIDLRLSPSLGTGLIASTPWITVLVSALAIGVTGSPMLLLLCPPALAGAIWQIRASGLLRSRQSVTRLVVVDNHLYAELADGRQFTAHARTESRLLGHLALLKLTLVGARLRPPLVVITSLARAKGPPCNSDPAAFRQFRVWLRLAGSTGQNTRT